MKKNWQTKKLSEVCDFLRGLTYSKKDETDFSDNVVLRSNNIDLMSNLLNFDELRFIKNEILIPDSKKVKKGSIIICTANGSKSHLGKFAQIDKDYGYAFGGFMGQLIPHNEINSKYFFYILKSDLYKKHLAKISSGANINNLKFSDLSELEIPLPPLSEQHRIVKILDEVFEKVAKAKSNAEKNLQNAKELFESYSQSVFINQGIDWDVKKIGDVCDLKSGTTIPVALERNEGDVLYTKIADMNLPENQVEINTSSRFVSSEEIKINQIIPEGAVIFPKRGGAIATNKKRKIVKPTIVDLNTMALVPSEKLDKDYLFHWFQLIDLNDISNGTSIAQINNYSFDDVYIAYPKSLTEQKSIVTKLDALSAETKKLEAIYKQKIADLEELKKSVLKKAFEGEL